MKMTKANTATLARLEAALELQQSNVFAAALPRNDVRFWDCLKMCSHTVRASYEAACDARESFQRRMVDEGRAWRGQNGGFIPNN